MKKSLCLGLAIATIVIVASLFVPISTLAKAQPAQSGTLAGQECPVEVKVTGGGFGNHVKFKNVSTHPIMAIVFHSMRLNAVGEEVSATEREARAKAAFSIPDHSEQTFSDRKGLAPQAEKSMGDNMAFYGHPQKGDQFITYVRAVKFADGTVWNDDGSHSCKDGGI